MKLIYFLSLLFNLTLVKCDCDTYFSCLNNFVGNFFKSVSYKPSHIKENGDDFIDFDKDNINKILSGVNGFLRNELKKTLDLDAEYESENKNDGANIFVKTFVIGDFGDFDLEEELLGNNTQVMNVTEASPANFESKLNSFNVENSTESNQKKIQEKDIKENEIPDYYNDDNSSDYAIIDYIELYKDTTNEIIELTTEILKIKDEDKEIKSHGINSTNNGNFTTQYVTESCPGGTNDDVTSVFTWIAAIFIKNDTDQFQYYCDGAVLSKNSIITAARCVNLTLADDIIVILGKTSLQEAKDTEKMIKISDVIVHENFTETSNDLAILKTEEAIETTKAISIACLSADDEYDDAMTTGWPIGEDLTAVKFDKSKSEACTTDKEICGVYNQSITFCPSHSGVFAVHSTGWYLAGIRTVTTGDHDRTTCIHKPVYYTPLRQYTEWIQQNI